MAVPSGIARQLELPVRRRYDAGIRGMGRTSIGMATGGLRMMTSLILASLLAAQSPAEVLDHLPPRFTGIFSEDIHECGTEGVLVITGKSLRGQGHAEAVQEVEVLRPNLVQVSVRDDDGTNRSYRMELSDDEAEIKFIYTNIRFIQQRCNVRAHAR